MLGCAWNPSIHHFISLYGSVKFMFKFVKGDLQYFVANTSYENFIYAYTLENRSVYEQKLELTQAQKQSLFDELNKIYIQLWKRKHHAKTFICT